MSILEFLQFLNLTDFFTKFQKKTKILELLRMLCNIRSAKVEIRALRKTLLHKLPWYKHKYFAIFKIFEERVRKYLYPVQFWKIAKKLGALDWTPFSKIHRVLLTRVFAKLYVSLQFCGAKMSSSEVKNSVSNQNENLQKLLQAFKDIDNLIAPTDSTLSVEGNTLCYIQGLSQPQ